MSGYSTVVRGSKILGRTNNNTNSNNINNFSRGRNTAPMRNASSRNISRYSYRVPQVKKSDSVNNASYQDYPYGQTQQTQQTQPIRQQNTRGNFVNNYSNSKLNNYHTGHNHNSNYNNYYANNYQEHDYSDSSTNLKSSTSEKSEIIGCESNTSTSTHEVGKCSDKKNKNKVTLRKCLLAECKAKYECADVKVLIFDIIISNKTDKKLTNVSVNDSILGLISTIRCLDIDITSFSETLFPLESHQVLRQHGELLDCRSYIDPCSTCHLILKIVAKGIVQVGNEHCYDDTVLKPCSLLTANNTIILTGKLESTYKSGWKREEEITPIFYVSTAICGSPGSKKIYKQECEDSEQNNCCNNNYDSNATCNDLYELIEV